MNLILITRDHRLYWPDMFKDFLARLPDDIEVTDVLLTTDGIDGQGGTRFSEIRSVFGSFGLGYFLRVSAQHIASFFRGRSVQRICKRHQITTRRVSDVNEPAIVESIRQLEPDVIFSLGNSQILGPDVLALPRLGAFTIHHGQLPQFRGLMPIFWTMYEGEENVTISVCRMSHSIDFGEVLYELPVEIGSLSFEEAIRKAKRACACALLDSLERLELGKPPIRICEREKSRYYGWPKRRDVQKFLSNGKRLY